MSSDENKNPWYVLATLHGEESSTGHGWYFDETLVSKNRIEWNRYFSRCLTDNQRTTLLSIKNNGISQFSEQELTPHSDEEYEIIKKKFRDNFANRTYQPRSIRESVIIPDINENINFDNETFKNFLNMSGFLFVTQVRFKNTTFSHNVRFDRAVFFETARFVDAKFSQAAGFRNATFFGEVLFDNSRFESNTNFDRACFKVYPPRFHGASLHEGTEWHGVTWPDSPNEPEDAQKHVYNYERLKQEMERLKKHDDELRFFALETRAKRVTYKAYRGWRRYGSIFPNWLYEKSSFYGQSIVRPALGLMVTIVVGAIAIASWMGWGRADWYWLPKFKNAIGLSLANVLAPLNMRKDYFDAEMLAALPGWLKILGGTQTLLGLLFAFLLGLALRNRFRLK